MLSRNIGAAIAVLCVLPVALGASGGSGCDEVEIEKPKVARLIPPEGVNDAEVIPDQYILGLINDASAATVESVKSQIVGQGGRLHHVYWPHINAIAAYIPPEKLNVFLQNPHLQYIERDRIVRATGTVEGVQTCVQSWGLDRIDQTESKLNGIYTYSYTGKSVHVYVLDSGIDIEHTEFNEPGSKSRVIDGTCTVRWAHNGATECDVLDAQGKIDPQKVAKYEENSEWWNDRCAHDPQNIDPNSNVPVGNKKSAGHGTHMAGIVGGRTTGVAKRIKLHAVRVLGCHEDSNNPAATCDVKELLGAGSDLIAGIEWSVEKHKKITASMEYKDEPGIILIGSSVHTDPNYVDSFRAAVSYALNEGLLMVVSAGNEGKDAMDYSPGGDIFNPSQNNAVTVGALDSNDRRWDKSNFGSFVDIFAPGTDIVGPLPPSACYPTGKSYRPMSGTSQAAAHVAGVAALLWEDMNAGLLTVKAPDIANRLKSQGRSLMADNLGDGSPSLGLYIDTNLVGSPPSNSGLVDAAADACHDRAELKDGEMHIKCGEPFACPAEALYGIHCESGNCTICGSEGDKCCDAGLSNGKTCKESLMCDSSGKCACGEFGEPCCKTSMGPYCDGPWTCNTLNSSEHYCGACGNKDQVCCNGACNESHLACNKGNKCVDCGGPGEPCCPGDACNADNLTCIGSTCTACGTVTKPCCEGMCLADGLLCDAQSICSECGGPGEPCCPGDACNADNLTCAGNTCTACGTKDTPCCEGLCLGDGLLCDTKSFCRKCGEKDSPCCPGGACNADNLTCNGTKCVKCGNVGEPCCEGTCLADDGLYCSGKSCKALSCYVRCMDNALPKPNVFGPDKAACVAASQKACKGHDGVFMVRYGGMTAYCNGGMDGCYTRCENENWKWKGNNEYGECVQAAAEDCEPSPWYARRCYVTSDAP